MGPSSQTTEIALIAALVLLPRNEQCKAHVGFLPIPLGTDFQGGKRQHQMVLGQAPGHCLLSCAVGQEMYLL